MKTKYKIIFVTKEGVSGEVNFSQDQKEEAIARYKYIKQISIRAKFFNIDSEDETIWYDWSNKF